MTIGRTNIETSAALRDAARRADALPYPAARRALSAWFDACGRRFPWRENPTPYRVLVSEMMLQQTTTQTVLGYFERFIERFPTPETLAAASEDDVLAAWEGLGYYRRARALRAAAIVMIERFRGAVPDSFDDLLALPGVGRYCAGAVASFGFDKRAPILEANTTRLHSRLIALDVEPELAPANRILWSVAEKWLPREGTRRAPGIYRKLNAALTDLGRLICQPGVPKCGDCPAARFCAAYELGLQTTIPRVKKKSVAIQREDVAFWISRRDLEYSSVPTEPGAPESPDDALLTRRPRGTLWAGLWDFPKFELKRATRGSNAWRDDPVLVERLAFFLETEVGAPPASRRPGPALKVFRHSVTRYRVALTLCRLQGADSRDAEPPHFLFDVADANSSESTDCPVSSANERDNDLSEPWELRWVPVSSLKKYPLSSPARKIADYIEETTSNLASLGDEAGDSRRRAGR